MERQDYSAALAALRAAQLAGERLDTPFVDLFPVDGATVATLGDLLGTATLFATDELASRLDEVQFELGEGPCWSALDSATAVIEADVRGHARRRWPAFGAAISGEDVGSIVAFPLVIGTLRIGAIDLYSRSAVALDEESLEQGGAMANLVARDVFRRTLTRAGRNPAHEESNPLSRRVIEQATGIVLAQLGLSATDARLVLEGHAFARDEPLVRVAQRVVASEGLRD